MRPVIHVLSLCLSIFAVSSLSTGAAFAHNHEGDKKSEKAEKKDGKEAHCEKCHDKDGKKAGCEKCVKGAKSAKGESCKECPECKDGKKSCADCSMCKDKHAKQDCEGCKHDGQKDHKHEDGHAHKHSHAS